MSLGMCEKCWADAELRVRSFGGSQYEHYMDLLTERRSNPCSPEEQEIAKKKNVHERFIRKAAIVNSERYNRELLIWIIGNLLTDSQLNVVAPGCHKALRFTKFQ
jgi:hypothetical protein